MSDVDTSQGTPGTTAADAAPTKTPDGAQQPADDITALKAEIDRKEKLLKATQSKLAKFEDESKKAQELAMQEQGKFKELAEKRAAELEAAQAQLTTFQDRITAIEEAQKNELGDILKTLSDDDKEIVGFASGVEAQLKAARKLAQRKPEPPDPNRPGKGGGPSKEIKYQSMKGLK